MPESTPCIESKECWIQSNSEQNKKLSFDQNLLEPEIFESNEKKPCEVLTKAKISDNQQEEQNKECTSVSKYTWKYDVQIKSLPGFSVARKIIGFKGKNMKDILNKLKVNNFKGPIQDVIKLRLRGQGSGFKEGPKNVESSEPLHLWISSKYYDKYVEACKLVESLLKSVYWEYNNYCNYIGIPTQKYRLKKRENNPASALSNS